MAKKVNKKIGSCWGCGDFCEYIGAIPRCPKCFRDYKLLQYIRDGNKLISETPIKL